MVDAKHNDVSKVALDHAWAWFSLHAAHRLQSVNFFLIATAFLSAAFVGAASQSLYAIAGVVAMLGTAISYFFYRMECRIRSLIHASERAIQPLQDQLAHELKLDAIRIVSHVEAGRPGEWKYSKVFRYLYVSTGAAFAFGLLYISSTFLPNRTDTIAFGSVLQASLGVYLVFIGHEMLSDLSLRPEIDDLQHARRLALLILGVLCIVVGVTVISYLAFVRL